MPIDHTSSPITPWPFPPDARDVILVGGTFDPPHSAHIDLPRQLRDLAFPSSALLFIPAAWSPLKSGAPQTPPHHRIQMLHLAIRDLPRAAIWTDEIDRHAFDRSHTPSFTIDTIIRAKSIAPTTNLRLLMGADQAAQFHRWHRFREILALAPPVVMFRDPHPTADSLSTALLATNQWSPKESKQWISWCTPELPTTDLSASDIRAALRAGKPARTLSALNPDVAAYIDKHHLYAPLP